MIIYLKMGHLNILLALITISVKGMNCLVTNRLSPSLPPGNRINDRILPGISVGGINGIVSPIFNNQVPCGSTVEVVPGINYFISSPGYPNAYSPFTSCQWNFYTITNQPIILDCSTFQLAPNTQCSNGAFLAVDSGTSQFQWYCGSSGPSNVASSANTMNIYFWGSWQNTNNYQGFSCTVSTSTFTTASSAGGSCRCGKKTPTNRIVGGEETGIHEFPWLVLLVPVCGGTLINENFVLTAAHCIREPALPNGTLPTAYIGEHRRSVTTETAYTTVMKAKAIYPHENYERNVGISIKDFDIGLVELERPVSLTFTPFIAPACAPNPLLTYENVTAVVAGWGYTSFPNGSTSDVLMKAELQTVPLSKCKSDYTAGIITNKMICTFTQGKDACFSDSGSPLMTQQGDSWVVIGIVSFGPEACAHPSKSGVYTRVGDYLTWISSKIGNSRTCPP